MKATLAVSAIPSIAKVLPSTPHQRTVMKYRHFTNQQNDLTLACPITGRLLYDQGRFLEHENKDYGIPLILLPPELLARALKNPAQWEAWQKQRRLTIDPAPAGDPDLFRAVSIRPSRYGEGWIDPRPERETIPLSEITADPIAFAEAHQKLDLETSLLKHDEKMELLKAAEITLTEATQPNDLPGISGVHLTDNVIDVFAQRGYDDPIYHIANDDDLYFNYLRAVPDNSFDQAMAYFETLPDSYLVYGVTCVDEDGGESVNLHLIE